MILMIDDERRRMSTIKDYMESKGYIVELIYKINDVTSFVKTNLHDIDAIILDIMMPWGDLFTSEDTEFGLISRFKLYEYLRGELHFTRPIIVYTALNRI